MKHHPDVETDVLMDVDYYDGDDDGFAKISSPGETLTSSHAFMRYVSLCTVTDSLMCWCRGHGTYIDTDDVIASVAGTIDRVNKLVSVRAINTRSTNPSFPNIAR